MENKLSKMKDWILYLMIFLLPTIFWQSKFIGIYPVKIALLATGLVILTIIFFITVLSEKKFSVPRSKIYLPLVIFMVGASISSLFSGNVALSFLGTVFDLGTTGSLIILCGVLIVISVLFESGKAIKFSLFVFLFSQLLTLIYIVLRSAGLYFLPSFFSKWNILPAGGVTNTAILMGAAVIISLCILNMTGLSKKIVYSLWFLIIGGVLFIGASGFTPAVIFLGLFSLVFFVYLLSWSVSREQSFLAIDQTENRVSIAALIVLIMSVIFMISGGNVTGVLSDVFKVSSVEIRPSIGATLELISKSWSINPLLGTGPNKFVEFWSKNKPIDINLSQFWGTDFSFGYGFIPTLAVTMGFLGLAPLLFFLLFLAYKGFRVIFMPENATPRFITIAIFLSVIYFWLVSFVYVPDISVLGITFIFSGLLIVALYSGNTESRINVEMFSNPKINFISVLSIVLLLILSVAAGYFVWEKVLATRSFGQGVAMVNAGDIDNGRIKIAQAINTTSADIYWRTLAESSLIKFNSILQAESGNSQLSEKGQAELQIVVGEAVEAAKQAVKANSAYYLNWLTLANTYEILAANNVQEALPSAKSAYNEAISRSPNNPALRLAMGRIEAASGNLEGAKIEINKAIELKRNYTDAYFTLARIEVSSNNLAGAIKSVENAAVIDPNNSGLFFQLGLLKYNNEDFSEAATSFERAISLLPNYANAKYFLGLSYHSLGKNNEAVKQFEDIKASNPDNMEIDLILSNLKAGKNPFAGAKPPIDKEPEKRKEPPIEE